MENLNKIVLNNLIKNNSIILILFWMEFCLPCKIIKKNIKEIKNIFKNKISVVEVNINYNSYIIEKFSINSAPTIIIIKNKKIIIKKRGILNKNSIKLIIKDLI